MKGERFLSFSLPERAIDITGGTTASCFFILSVTTGTAAFAFTQSNDCQGHKGKDNQQHYDGGKVHEMMALAMR
ncbi:MAG: hypothetical protein IKM95_08755 [Bacteroidales bacterium]|nr:hypothetical protein [Bacteroidales bacterium]